MGTIGPVEVEVVSGGEYWRGHFQSTVSAGFGFRTAGVLFRSWVTLGKLLNCFEF